MLSHEQAWQVGRWWVAGLGYSNRTPFHTPGEYTEPELARRLEPFAALLLQAHMAQHLLLMMAAPPLVWLGEPLFPLLRGLPVPFRSVWIAPLFRSPLLRGLCTRLTHPAVALALFVAATWLWHAPALYDLAVRSDAWHYAQHACFLATALLFWFAVVRPRPSRPPPSRPSPRRARPRGPTEAARPGDR